MYQKMQKKYQSDVMAALWKVMEEELELQFKDRKQRNLSKNKPARFEHFKVGLPIIIDVKKDMHKNGVIADLSLDLLSISKHCLIFIFFLLSTYHSHINVKKNKIKLQHRVLTITGATGVVEVLIFFIIV